MKKTVHIISHTHWDREWYLPLENHTMRLVDLVDGLIEACEDPRFKYFQFDGQYLPIEDYLKVRPENKEILKELRKSGRIITGPWYILQDAFLTSGESNVKDLSLGIKKSSGWGKPASIGYFPDTFGNIGQAPQILNKAGIDVSYFGRGVKATGFDNAVIEDFTSKNSELIWKSNDGSEVLGILFANWYCNGVDIPSKEDKLRKYMDQKIADMEKYAATNQLLLMNGCDHSPVQKNIGEIIEKLNTMYDGYEFVHSNLDLYYEAVNKEIDRKKLAKITGELRSQTTDGWYTLQGTSSSRYYLKYMNKNLEMRLEEVTQPLLTIFGKKEDYPHDRIDYIYERLISNHPHDSICGCSIDSVHDGNRRRFKDAAEALDYIDQKQGEFIAKNTYNDSDYVSFCLINTLPYERSRIVSIDLDYMKEFFGANFPEVVKKLKEIDLPDLTLVDDNGNEIPGQITDIGTNFGYELPEDVFRKPYFSRQVNVKFMAKLRPYEKKIFRLVEGKSKYEVISYDKNLIENDFYQIKINDNASLDIKDKRTNEEYTNVLTVEDSGDIGNEYIYRQSYDNLRILGGKLIDKEVLRENDKYIIKLTEEISIPKSADQTLFEEQVTLVGLPFRQAKRSKDYVKMEIYKEIIVYDEKSTMDIKIKLKNMAKDHRMRLLFGHKLESDFIYPESIFETVKRSAYPPKTWENPDYSQNLNRYIQVKDEADKGFTVSTIGIAEYEQVKDEGLYLTLFRSTGELGDWGYFPTPDAQLLGDLADMEFDLYLDIFDQNPSISIQKALKDRVPFFKVQIDKNTDTTSFNPDIPDIDLGENLYSILYRNYDGDPIFRAYNPSNEDKQIPKLNGENYDILGQKPDNRKINKGKLSPVEIRTTKLDF